MRPLLLLTAFILIASCSDHTGPPGELLLGWNFADGRLCAESGVHKVAVHTTPDTEDLPLYDCAAGQGAAQISIPLPAGDYILALEGRSVAQTPLYSGHTRASIPAGGEAAMRVELAFTGGL